MSLARTMPPLLDLIDGELLPPTVEIGVWLEDPNTRACCFSTNCATAPSTARTSRRTCKHRQERNNGKPNIWSEPMVLAARCARALAAALQGDDAALDDYAEARRRVATESVQNTSNQSYVNLTVTDPRARENRDRELRAMAADPVQARAFLLRQAMLDTRI